MFVGYQIDYRIAMAERPGSTEAYQPCSLSTQSRRIKSYGEQQGEELVEMFTDRVGRRSRRFPQLEAAIRLCRQRKATLVVGDAWRAMTFSMLNVELAKASWHQRLPTPYHDKFFFGEEKTNLTISEINEKDKNFQQRQKYKASYRHPPHIISVLLLTGIPDEEVLDLSDPKVQMGFSACRHFRAMGYAFKAKAVREALPQNGTAGLGHPSRRYSQLPPSEPEYQRLRDRDEQRRRNAARALSADADARARAVFDDLKELRQTGLSDRSIALIFNERSLRPARGKEWQHTSIRNMRKRLGID